MSESEADEQEPRTGDHVFHEPSGETWVVAFTQGGLVAWCGWPAGMAKLSDCRVVKRCSDDESLKMLNELAAMTCDDFRASHARDKLLRNRYSNRESLSQSPVI